MNRRRPAAMPDLGFLALGIGAFVFFYLAAEFLRKV